MTRHLLIALLIAALSVALSLLLVPGGEELALMFFKDGEFAQAERRYREELSRRGMQRRLVMPLNALALEGGRIDEALGLTRRFAKDNPDDAEVLALLADYQRQAQRPGEHVATLEQLERIAPSPARLRELAEWYDYQGRPRERRAALRRLVGDATATPEEVLALARLDAAAGDLDSAVALLDGAARRGHAALQPQAVLLLGALLADSGQPARLRALAAEVERGGQGPGQVLDLARMLHGRGHPELALGVVDALAPAARDGDEALAFATFLETSLGRSAGAVRRLLARERAQPLSAALEARLVEAALDAGDEALALARGARLAPGHLPEWILPGLVQAALDRGQPDTARALIARIGEARLAQRPLFAAQAALALGERSEAHRWALRAAESAGDDAARAELALLLRALGDDARARSLLAGIALEKVPPGLRADVARLYLALGEARRGLQELERAGADRGDVWALLSAASGHEREVLEWLAGPAGRRAGDAVLSDLYSLAEQATLPRLRLALAERGAEVVATPAWRLRLALTLYDQGRAREALPVVRALRESVPEAAAMYPQVLLLALRGDPALAPEMDAWLARRLREQGIGAADTEQIVYDLLDARALRSALPVLERLARERGGSWPDAWLDVLDRLDEREALAAALESRLAQPALERGERQSLLLRLARAGAVERALAAFEEQVLDDRSSGQGWLYAYLEAADALDQGPRADAFLERAVVRPGAPAAVRDARAWALLPRLGPERALALLRGLAAVGPGTWEAGYREALVRLDRGDELARHLVERAAAAPAPERRAAAFALLDLGRKDDAVALFTTLAAEGGPHGPDAEQLLYLWGPRPGGGAEDWLADRVAESSGGARAAWARRLIGIGAAGRAVALLAADATAGAELSAAYLEALVAAGDREGARRQLERLLARATDSEALRRLARLAAEQDHPAAALAAWARVLALVPGDRPALRQLGLASYDAGDWRRAVEHLGEYLRLGKGGGQGAGDYEVQYFLAESLVALEQAQRAAPHFAAAVRLVDAAPLPDFRMRTVRAQSLHRLGRTHAAAAAYEKLLAERPAAGHLRADFGDMLIDSGDLSRAAAVLR